MSPVDLTDLYRLGHATNQSEAQLFVSELITLFLKLGPANYKVARAALSAGDGASLRRASHKLKSQAAYFGAKQLVKTCLALELMSQRLQLARCETLLDELEDELDRVVCALLLVQRGTAPP
jgi:HPt (histidine-containing phosphotransfer) domain-containing protein